MKTKVILLFVLITLTFLLGIGGCGEAPKVKTTEPAVIVETYDPSLLRYEALWKAEIGRRFNHAVGILAHGGDLVEGEWIIAAHAQPWRHVSRMTDIVKAVQRKHPTRTIVVLSCNPGHLKLGIPGVYYATGNVWCVPDRNITDFLGLPELHRTFVFGDYGMQTFAISNRWQMDSDTIGNIFEFVVED